MEYERQVFYRSTMALALEQIDFDPGKSFRFLAWTDNLTEVVQCRADGTTVSVKGAGESWHFHPEYELTLVTEGRGKRFVGDHVGSFRSPDLVLLGPNLPHCWSGLEGSSGFAIQFVMDQSHPVGMLDEIRHLTKLLQGAAGGIHFTGDIVSRIEEAMRKMTNEKMIYRLSTFFRILAELSSVDEDQCHQLSSSHSTINEHDPHMTAMSQAVSYILSHISEEIHIDELLQVTKMSRPSFARHFKRHTGKTVTAFLNEVRIVNAKRLLAETNRPVTEIAYASGFQNISHFNVQFRRASSESPSQYRKRQTLSVS